MKYPQQAPVSTVSYEKMGIGQQNALNQANLETIQKNIETKIQTQQNPLLLTQQPNNKYSDIIDGIESGKYKVKQTKFGMTITNPSLYTKPGPKAKIKVSKSIEEVKEIPGIKSKINTNSSTPQNPIYKFNDSAGISPEVKFEKSVYEMPQNSNDDLIDELFETDTDQTINITKDESNQNENENKEVVKEKKLTKAQQKKLSKQTNTNEANIQTPPVEPNTESSKVNLRSMNIKLGKKEAAINKKNEQLNKDAQQLKTDTLNLFT